MRNDSLYNIEFGRCFTTNNKPSTNCAIRKLRGNTRTSSMRFLEKIPTKVSPRVKYKAGKIVVGILALCYIVMSTHGRPLIESTILE